MAMEQKNKIVHNEMDVAQSNKLIAEFDGWRFVDISTDEYPDGCYEYAQEHCRTVVTPDNLHYHDEWSMLMPVVKKAKESTKEWDWTQLNWALARVDIDSVFSELIEFLDWNNQKK